MQRRFEFYTVKPGVSEKKLREVEGVLRNCGHFIPEVLDSVVGRNLSKAPVDFMWEHAYESPEAYQRYMVHPYHANLLDRYLLHDSPERVTMDNPLGPALVGYDCDGPVYYMDKGYRRLVIIGLKDGTPQEKVREFEQALRNAQQDVPKMTLCIVEYNSMGMAWRKALWTHLWEQGFKSLDDLKAYLRGRSAMAKVERAGWKGFMGGIVERHADFYWKVHKPV